MAFIFLRDKDMRRRVDTFFSGIKKKLIKLRLHAVLKKENQKQEQLLNDLGRKSWEDHIIIISGEIVLQKLGTLEDSKAKLEKEGENIESKIIALKKNLIEYRKNQDFQINKLESKKIPFEEKLIKARSQEKKIGAHIIEEQNLREGTVINLGKIKQELIELNNQKILSEEAAAVAAKESKVEKKEVLEKKRNEIDKKIKNLIAKKKLVEKDSNE